MLIIVRYKLMAIYTSFFYEALAVNELKDQTYKAIIEGNDTW